MKINLTDLDLFLDELRFRGPNIEPVVRVRPASEGKNATRYQLLATYARQYGEKIATIELRHACADLWPRLGLHFGETEAETKTRLEEDRAYYQRVAELRDEKYAEARARIAAVADELGIAVGGGEVTAEVA